MCRHAVFAHDAEVAGVQPAIGLDDLSGSLGIAIVAFHHRVAAHADFALHADGETRAVGGGDDLNFGLRHGAADGVDADFDGVSGVAHGDDGRGLGLAVGDDEFADVHFIEHALHQFDGTRSAAHHAGAQAGEVEGGELGQAELGNVHCGNAVDGGGALVVNGLKRCACVEGPVGQDDGSAGVECAHGSDDAAVAVEERHGDDDFVLLGVVKSLGEELAVVDHVVMGEHDALGQAGGAAGVLDVCDVVDGNVIGEPAFGIEQRWPLG